MPAANDRLADYVPVSERISKFYEQYDEGRILTTIVEHDREQGFILMRAEVYRSPDDAQPASTGHAYEVQNNGFVNKTSYIENCETGAVGRALAIMGYEIKRGIASREEMEKVDRMAGNGKKADPQAPLNQEQDELDSRRRLVMEACGTLNAAKDKIVWTGAALTKFIKDEFNVKKGLHDLTLPQVRELQQLMASRLDKLKSKDLSDEDEPPF